MGRPLGPRERSDPAGCSAGVSGRSLRKAIKKHAFRACFFISRAMNKPVQSTLALQFDIIERSIAKMT